MTKSDLKVVRVVSRGDFNNTCTLSHIGVFVANDRNFLIKKRKNNVTAVEMLISRVVAVNCNRSIAEHSFGTGSCKFKLFACFLNLIKKMPEIRVFFFIFNLGIRNGSITMRAPVYHTVTTINKVLFIKSYKYFSYRLTAALVQGEPLPVPIAGRAHFLKLFNNSAAVLLFPIPSTFKEFFTSEVIFCKTLFAHSLNNLSLCCDRSVVCARKPQGIVSCHSVIADKNILKRIIKCVTHMKLTGNIRRRNNYCISFFAFFSFSVKILLITPKLIGTVLNFAWIVLFCKFLCHNVLLYNIEYILLYKNKNASASS